MTAGDARLSRDERLRAELFPEYEHLVFSTATRGFVPVPIDYRSLLRYLTTPQVRVLFYLLLRVSRFGICFPTLDEIAYDIGVTAKKHVRPLLSDLQLKGFIRIAETATRTYYLILDPSVAVVTMRSQGLISVGDMKEINRLRIDLGRERIEDA